MNLKTLHLYSERLSRIANSVMAEIDRRDYRQALMMCAEAHTVAQKISQALLQRTTTQKGEADDGSATS
jgi:hypothetical protein